MTKELIQNDFGKDMTFTLTDGDGNAMNLTGNTLITFTMTNQTGTAATKTGTCSVVDAEAGTCKYTIQEGDLATLGVYDYEIQVKFSGIVSTAPGADTISGKEELTAN